MTNISQKWLNKDFEVLRIFGDEYHKRLRESEIVGLTKLPQRTVSRKLNNLSNLGILSYIREGKNKIYSLDKNNPSIFQILVLVESYKSITFLNKHPKLALILKDIPQSLIFGSYAKNNAGESSDLDLVIFSNKKKEIEQAVSKSPVEIHAQFSSLDNLKEKLRKKDALALEIKNSHIILNGFDALIKIFMEHAYG